MKTDQIKRYRMKHSSFIVITLSAILLFTVLTFNSCKKDNEQVQEPPNKPSLLSPYDEAIIESTNVTLSWSCTDPNNDSLIYNVYLDENNPPSSSEALNIIENELFLSSLKPNTTYYWFVSARDNNDTTESNYYSFTTGDNVSNFGSLIDPRDNQTYITVKIGDQVWLGENLNFETIDSKIYNNESINDSIYGRLYTWDAALNICPNGWHLPSSEEWIELMEFLGGSGTAGGKLKEEGTAHWYSSNSGTTNESGFTALPGGFCIENDTFLGIGWYANFWTSSDGRSYFSARCIKLERITTHFKLDYVNQNYYLSVRCIKN